MDIIRRLATSQARGDRQLSFVNELLVFRPVGYRIIKVPGKFGTSTAIYGLSQLSHASWVNLRKRLLSVGFVIEHNHETMSVRMAFPEANTLF